MTSKQITVGVGIPKIVTGFLIAIFWAPIVGDVKDTVEFIGSLIGIIGVILFIAGLFYTKQPVAAWILEFLKFLPPLREREYFMELRHYLWDLQDVPTRVFIVIH